MELNKKNTLRTVNLFFKMKFNFIIVVLLNGFPRPPDSAVAVKEAGECDGGEGGAGEDDDHDEVGHGLRHVATDLGGGGVEEGGPTVDSHR